MKIIYSKNLSILVFSIYLFPMHIYASNMHTLDSLRRRKDPSEENSQFNSFWTPRDQDKKRYLESLLKEYHYNEKKIQFEELQRKVAIENRLKKMNQPTNTSQEEINKLFQKYKNHQMQLKKMYDKIIQKVESKYPSSGLKGYFEDWKKETEDWFQKDKKEIDEKIEADFQQKEKQREAYWKEYDENQKLKKLKEDKEHQARLQKRKEEHQARLQKRKEEHQARLQKRKEEHQARLQQQIEEEQKNTQEEKMTPHKIIQENRGNFERYDVQRKSGMIESLEGVVLVTLAKITVLLGVVGGFTYYYLTYTKSKIDS